MTSFFISLLIPLPTALFLYRAFLYDKFDKVMKCLVKAYFEIKKNAVGGYYFTLRIDKSHNLVVTESFLKRSELEKCISNLREAAAVAEICEFERDVKPPLFQLKKVIGGYICCLSGFSGKTIFTSEKYAIKKDCLDTMGLIKKLSADAGIIDNT